MRGGSQPWLLRSEDGGFYVVKFQSNPQHVRVLANEMLAGQLARLIGLPAAQPAFIEVSSELTPPGAAANAPAGAQRPVEPPARDLAGLHFGSRFPGDPTATFAVEFLPDPLLRRVQNLRETFLGALVFDQWTSNCDGRQVLFRRPASSHGEYTACLIDHGFCFSDGDWDFHDGIVHGLYPRRLVYESVRDLDSFEPFLNRIENLQPAELSACAEEIPETWCDGEPGGPARLMESLYLRRRTLRQALVDLKNSSLRPFPNWR